jgi:hypothetical protein
MEFIRINTRNPDKINKNMRRPGLSIKTPKIFATKFLIL